MKYLERIERGLQRVAADGNIIDSLVFGDLHLVHVKHHDTPEFAVATLKRWFQSP